MNERRQAREDFTTYEANWPPSCLAGPPMLLLAVTHHSTQTLHYLATLSRQRSSGVSQRPVVYGEAHSDKGESVNGSRNALALHTRYTERRNNIGKIIVWIRDTQWRGKCVDKDSVQIYLTLLERYTG